MDLARQEQYQSSNSNNNNSTQMNNNQPGGGLLRFRSAPSSLFSTNLESDESRIMCSKIFMDDDDHLNFPDYEDKPSLLLLQPPITATNSSAAFPTQQHTTVTAAAHTHHTSELPPQYPRNPITSSGSGLARQSSSPAGFFSAFNNCIVYRFRTALVSI